MLDHLLALLWGHATLLGNDVTQNQVDLPGHVGGVTTHVKVGLLLQQLADKRSVLLQAVLDIDLLGTLTREGGNDLQRIAELLLPSLIGEVSMLSPSMKWGEGFIIVCLP